MGPRAGHAEKGEVRVFSWVGLEPMRSEGGSGAQVRGEGTWRACEVHFYEVYEADW